MDFQLNEYVITQICGYLPLSDLKIVRSLNFLWNLGSSPILVEKGCNNLNFKNSSKSLEESISFIGNHFPCQSLRISINIPNNQERSPDDFQYVDYSKLFSPNSKKLPPVSHLQLNFRIFNEADVELLNDILQYYSKSLKILVVAINGKKEIIKLRPSIKFPELSVFWNLAWWEVDKIYQQLLAAATASLVYIEPCRRLGGVFGLTCIANDPKFDTIIVGNISITGLQNLNRWGKKLRYCIFENFNFVEDKATLSKELERFLQNQANSLEFLDFRDLSCDFKLKWPRFPNLEKLRMEFKNGCKFEICGNLAFNYERDFPKLKSLTIFSNFGVRDVPESLVSTYNSFFPKDGNQICQSLHTLKLPKTCLEVVENLEERLKKLFPWADIIFK